LKSIDLKPELPDLVASNIEYFVGRTWLLSYILKWLDESNQRIFILKGAPGTGKSTVLAWLAGAGPLPNDSNARGQLEKIRSNVKASHFLMSNTGNTAPKAFAESVARQLTQNVSQFGELLINSLDRGRIQINSVQNVGRAQSVVAVNIAKLDLGGLTDEFSFDSVFREPLK
jgi:nucleoside-triphosphatase THEP1